MTSPPASMSSGSSSVPMEPEELVSKVTLPSASMLGRVSSGSLPSRSEPAGSGMVMTTFSPVMTPSWYSMPSVSTIFWVWLEASTTSTLPSEPTHRLFCVSVK